MSESQETTLWQGARISVQRWEGVSPRGKHVQREIVRHPGAVVILPLLEDQRVVLIKNYRPAAGGILLELPAGTLEPPEPPQLAAQRELKEETGYHCDRLDSLPACYMSPGFLDEVMHPFVATGLVAGEAEREEGEEIENLLAPLEQVIEWTLDGTIQDAKTILTILRYVQRKST